MTTVSTSTNDHAALLSTIGGAAGVAPQLPPMQLSGALDTTACTTYDGALFGISAEMIKWAKDRKDPPMLCLSRHQQVKMSLNYGVGFKARMEAGLVVDGCLPRTQWQDARYSYVLLVKEAVDPMTASIIAGGTLSPSEMFDGHFESVAMRTCDSNWYIMRKYDLTVRSLWWLGFKVSKIKVFGPFDQSIMAQVAAALNVPAMKWAELAASAAEHQSLWARAMERPVDDLIEARGRIQAMVEATLGGEDWKPILPLFKPVVVAPAAVVIASEVPHSAAAATPATAVSPRKRVFETSSFQGLPARPGSAFCASMNTSFPTVSRDFIQAIKGTGSPGYQMCAGCGGDEHSVSACRFFNRALFTLQGGGLVDKFDATKRVCMTYNIRGCFQSCVREHACLFCKGQHKAFTHVGSA